jgi:glycosyltransferase involved in cell wall biosynthesis
MSCTRMFSTGMSSPEAISPKMTSAGLISLIVATVGRIEELDRLLANLDRQSHRDFEVIVVDQNPDHRLAPVLERHPALSLRRLRSERGLSRARNCGLAASRGDLIAIPDDDCWYPPELLASVAAWFRTHPEYGLLGTALRTDAGEPSGPRAPRAAMPCTRRNVWRCAVSTALFLRREVSGAVGGFNDQIGVGCQTAFQSGEETDYVLRALGRGFQMWYEPGLTVHHPALDSIERLRKTTYPSALGSGRVLRMHGYRWHEVGGHLMRSLGGAAVSLCRGELRRAEVYVRRASGQLVGYLASPEAGSRRA